jgi:hypothetical protein
MSVMVPQVPRLAALPEARDSRMRTAATWLLVLPLLTVGVLPGVVKLQVTGLAVLAFVMLVRGPLPERAVERVFAVTAVLALIVIAYLAFSPWPELAGTARSYDGGAAVWAGTVIAVAVYAALFFDAGILERVIWRAATLALAAGVVTCAFSRLTGHLVLVNDAHGALRMYGTLGEPSAWAPVLAMVALLGLRRRARAWLALAVAGVVLADSPVCILVLAVTLPLYAALVTSWWYRALLLAALVVVIPAGVVLVQHADAQALMASGSPARIAAGRLVSGIQSAETGGIEGTNTRLTGTSEIISITRDSGRMRLGAGPSADTTYFRAMYPGGGGTTALEPNAVWVSVLFDFGEAGVAVLAVLMVTAAWRMRRYPVMAAVMLPWLVAATVNSGGTGSAVVVLAVLLFTFGWATRRGSQSAT